MLSQSQIQFHEMFMLSQSQILFHELFILSQSQIQFHCILLLILLLKLLPPAQSNPDNGMCCVMFAIICHICASQSNTPNFSKWALPHALFIWNEQHFANFFKLVCSTKWNAEWANGLPVSKAMLLYALKQADLLGRRPAGFKQWKVISLEQAGQEM